MLMRHLRFFCQLPAVRQCTSCRFCSPYYLSASFISLILATKFSSFLSCLTQLNLEPAPTNSLADCPLILLSPHLFQFMSMVLFNRISFYPRTPVSRISINRRELAPCSHYEAPPRTGGVRRYLGPL